ncbi:stage III sporulation protein AF [Paenibacillus alkaliterrae]|uniref:stage III sporulation protein AF n=1 Tax=Paenibacillus alkaliterrae TaxID=320909 RepID=UPI001F47F5EB|nr:stage III sporulation protein AF [Paenibacillus alkaliterrae]MCF2937506.1 stage III sporulation protein AF [Paenibacillus alkaliterrae]
MVAWLSDWLRDIIAVILLAVVVELLLPNKAMQRYARLVVGLFILMTILSPILKLMQSDISTRLDNGMELWSESAMKRGVPMAGLSQIQRDAEQLSEKRNLEAAKLAERTLEDSIKAELIERSKAPVDSVDAVLKWVVKPGGQTPYISQIIVTLKSGNGQDGRLEDTAPMKEVLPVNIAVEIEQIGGEGKVPASGPEHSERKTEAAEVGQKADEGWTGADPETTAAIIDLIEKGWGVASEQVVVRQPSQQKP